MRFVSSLIFVCGKPWPLFRRTELSQVTQSLSEPRADKEGHVRTRNKKRAIVRLECLTQGNGHVKPNETMSHFITFLLTISFGTFPAKNLKLFEAVFHIGRRLFDWRNPTWKSWSRTQSAAESRARSKVLSLHLLDGQPHHWLQMSNPKLRVSERNGFQK